MSVALTPVRRALFYLLVLGIVTATMYQAAGWGARQAAAQATAKQSAAAAPADQKAKLSDATKLADAALSKRETPPEAKPAAESPAANLSVWQLYQKGGVLMYPITFVSLVVVCFGVERSLGLRRRKVLPPKLRNGLRELAGRPGGLDIRAAYQLCRQFPSTAANVVRAMLLKVGRPDAELEQAVAEANGREASRLYFHVRWLNLSMSIAPMLGLLGTVQGMIIVFMGVSHLAPGANKAEYMAEGIYLKLVCTFAGLIVAIPAAVLAHVFEARIQTLMDDVEDLVLELLPHVERFEGRVRVRRGPVNQAEAPPPAAAEHLAGP
jgi:biopolymer transport protein ExbB